MKWISRTWFGFLVVSVVSGISAWKFDLSWKVVVLELGAYLLFAFFSTVKEYAGKYLDYLTAKVKK